MTTSLPHSQITDELLSAYIDGNVSESERILIESATQRDREVAWRLETLRQTVQLLRALPQIALPRSFSVEAVLASERGATQTPTPVTRRPVNQQAQQAGWWQSFLDFWRSGSPMLRNAAVGAMALFLVLGLGSQTLLVSSQIATPPAIQPVSQKLAVQPIAGEADTTAQSQQNAPAESAASVETAANAAADAAPGQETSALVFATPVPEDAAAQTAAEIAPVEPVVAPLSETTADESVVAAAAAPAEDEPQLAVASAPGRELSASDVSAKAVGGGVGGAPDGAESGDAEGVTAFDAAMSESVEAAPELMEIAPVGEIAAAPSAGGEEGAAARAPAAAAAALPAIAAPAESPTPLPTPTAVPTPPPATPTIAPMAGQAPIAATQQRQDSARARVTPPTSEDTAESSSLPSLLWIVQWGAAVLAPVFFVLWLRSRRVGGEQ